jgi:ketosteroid isomerase-like protein
MEEITIAERLYDAFRDRDAVALRALLTDDFVGQVSVGMPLAVGGRHEGPEAMLSEVWGPVFGAYDAAPIPDRYLPAGPGEVVVLGFYKGTLRADDREFSARFAHHLTIRADGVSSLEQITDTRSWPS